MFNAADFNAAALADGKIAAGFELRRKDGQTGDIRKRGQVSEGGIRSGKNRRVFQNPDKHAKGKAKGGLGFPGRIKAGFLIGRSDDERGHAFFVHQIEDGAETLVAEPLESVAGERV